MSIPAAADLQYVWGPRYVDDLVLRDKSTERLFAMQDANWNVVAIADASAVVQERYAYSPYGVPVFLTSTFTSRASSSFTWQRLFTGQTYDTQTGLHHFRNRMLHSQAGTFTTRDPIGYADGLNLYRAWFVTGRTDATGQKTCCEDGQMRNVVTVCIECEPSHCWITTKDTETGIQHSYGRWAAGYAYDGSKSGVLVDHELSKGRRSTCQRCSSECGFVPTVNAGYFPTNNNCASYATDEWQKINDEYLNAGYLLWDDPVSVCQSITNANGGLRTNCVGEDCPVVGGGWGGSIAGSSSGSSSSCSAPISGSVGSGSSGSSSGSIGIWW